MNMVLIPPFIPPPPEQLRVTVYGEEVDTVEEFVYLGRVIASDGTSDADIKRRLRLARVALTRIRKVVADPLVASSLRVQIVQAIPMAIATYGCETWSQAPEGMRRLAALQRAGLRVALGMTPKVHKDEEGRKSYAYPQTAAIYQRAKQPSILESVAKRKSDFAMKLLLKGHPLPERRALDITRPEGPSCRGPCLAAELNKLCAEAIEEGKRAAQQEAQQEAGGQTSAETSGTNARMSKAAGSRMRKDFANDSKKVSHAAIRTEQAAVDDEASRTTAIASRREPTTDDPTRDSPDRDLVEASGRWEGGETIADLPEDEDRGAASDRRKRDREDDSGFVPNPRGRKRAEITRGHPSHLRLIVTVKETETAAMVCYFGSPARRFGCPVPGCLDRTGAPSEVTAGNMVQHLQRSHAHPRTKYCARRFRHCARCQTAHSSRDKICRGSITVECYRTKSQPTWVPGSGSDPVVLAPEDLAPYDDQPQEAIAATPPAGQRDDTAAPPTNGGEEGPPGGGQEAAHVETHGGPTIRDVELPGSLTLYCRASTAGNAAFGTTAEDSTAEAWTEHGDFATQRLGPRMTSEVSQCVALDLAADLAARLGARAPRILTSSEWNAKGARPKAAHLRKIVDPCRAKLVALGAVVSFERAEIISGLIGIARTRGEPRAGSREHHGIALPRTALDCGNPSQPGPPRTAVAGATRAANSTTHGRQTTPGKSASRPSVIDLMIRQRTERESSTKERAARAITEMIDSESAVREVFEREGLGQVGTAVEELLGRARLERERERDTTELVGWERSGRQDVIAEQAARQRSEQAHADVSAAQADPLTADDTDHTPSDPAGTAPSRNTAKRTTRADAKAAAKAPKKAGGGKAASTTPTAAKKGPSVIELMMRQRAERDRAAREQSTREQLERTIGRLLQHECLERARLGHECDLAWKQTTSEQRWERLRAAARELNHHEHWERARLDREHGLFGTELAARERLERDRVTAMKADPSTAGDDGPAPTSTNTTTPGRVAAKRATHTDKGAATKAPKKVAGRKAASATPTAIKKGPSVIELMMRQKTERDRLARERAAAELAERELVERGRAAAEHAERERLAQEREAAEHAERERVERERAAAEHAERERLAQEQVAAEAVELAERERVERERAAAEHAERERLAQEQVAAERERVERERTAAERAERERLARERAAAELAERERTERERAAAELAEREHEERDRAVAEHAERERLARERAAAEPAERERVERERAAVEPPETPSKVDKCPSPTAARRHSGAGRTPRPTGLRRFGTRKEEKIRRKLRRRALQERSGSHCQNRGKRIGIWLRRTLENPATNCSATATPPTGQPAGRLGRRHLTLRLTPGRRESPPPEVCEPQEERGGVERAVAQPPTTPVPTHQDASAERTGVRERGTRLCSAARRTLDRPAGCRKQPKQPKLSKAAMQQWLVENLASARAPSPRETTRRPRAPATPRFRRKADAHRRPAEDGKHDADTGPQTAAEQQAVPGTPPIGDGVERSAVTPTRTAQPPSSKKRRREDPPSRNSTSPPPTQK